MDLGPEISDVLIDYDPVTLERKPVMKAKAREPFELRRNRTALSIIDKIPAADGILDATAVDDILLRSHYELQRVSELFEHGRRVANLLEPLLAAITRTTKHSTPVRIVDIGCGTGYVIRWLAKYLKSSDWSFELVGTDYNSAFIKEAQHLAREENLKCSFVTGNAFALEVPASIYMSTGVVHHFSGDHLFEFFKSQNQPAVLATVHFDFQSTPFSPLGSWMFHEILMREPLARHDGVLSARRAHPGADLMAAARAGNPDFSHEIYKKDLWGIPFLPRAMNAILSMRGDIKKCWRNG